MFFFTKQFYFRFDSNPSTTESESGNEEEGGSEKKKEKKKKDKKPKTAKTIVSCFNQGWHTVN